MRGKMGQHAKAGESDQSGLGRWNAIDINNDIKKVRVITGYRCVLSKQTNNTVFMQQLRYFQRIKREICLTKAFTYNLRDYIQTSIQQGFEIILSIDANEIMQCGRTATLLKSIGLIETTSLFTSKTQRKTFITGRFQIYAV